jgi:hypothetical protein
MDQRPRGSIELLPTEVAHENAQRHFLDTVMKHPKHPKPD